MSESRKSLHWQHFENNTATVFENYFKIPTMAHNFPIKIGRKTKKAHKFDWVSQDGKTCAIECKSISWSRTGKIPSTKISGINESVFFLSLLDGEFDNRCLAIKKSVCDSCDETLAEYYFRNYGHLLDGIRLFEIDPYEMTMRELT